MLWHSAKLGAAMSTVAMIAMRRRVWGAWMTCNTSSISKKHYKMIELTMVFPIEESFRAEMDSASTRGCRRLWLKVQE